MSVNLENHEKRIKNSLKCYKKQYGRWSDLLECEFNLMFHGYGSKIELLTDFVEQMYPHAYVVTLNGFCDNFNLFDAVATLAGPVLHLKLDEYPFWSQIEMIEDALKLRPDLLIVFVVHNFEKVQESNCDSEVILSRLSVFHNVRLVASVDHINATLNFSQATLDKMNMIYIKSTTFMPYTREVEDSERDQVFDDDSDKSLNQIMGVYQAFNDNSKTIFRLLVEEFVQNFKKLRRQGINMQDFFYSNIKNDLMITFDTFRVKLFELADQKLIEIKNEFELSEQLVKIPFPVNVLSTFLEHFKQNPV